MKNSIEHIFRASLGEATTLEDRFSQIAYALSSPGFLYLKEALEPEFIDQLTAFLHEKESANDLHRAGVGKNAALAILSEIRSDSIYWVDKDSHSTAVKAWIQLMEEMNTYLRRSLFLPVDTYEGHLAKYPAGGYYKPHIDQHKNTPQRQITIIAYLNQDWTNEDGGQLRLYSDVDLGIHGPYIDYLPSFGSMIIFRSADFWHEVLTSTRPRCSLTGWLRTRDDS